MKCLTMHAQEIGWCTPAPLLMVFCPGTLEELHNYRYVNSSNNVNDDITTLRLPGVRTVLTAKDGSVLISNLTISAVGAVVTNESTISCKDYRANVNTSVLRIIGE